MSPEDTLLVNANRLTIMRAVAAGQVHQLRNPVQAIMMAAETLSPHSSGEDLERMLPLLRTEAARANGFLDSLSQSLADDSSEPGPVSLEPLVRNVCEWGQAMRPRGDVRWERSPEGHLPAVRGTESGITLILLNLISNARLAVQGTADPFVGVTARSAGDAVLVTVSDNGPGITSIEGDPFDRFVTSRAGAPGVGLTAARLVASDFGAVVNLESGKDGRGISAGASFAVWAKE